MRNNIVFVGGIHGVGKNTLCRRVSSYLNIPHISSSEILKWKEVNKNTDKRVENIQKNQDKFIEGFKNIVSLDKYYLIDGHFCLLTRDNLIQRIPFDTFVTINPGLIVVMIEKSEIIYQRLLERDNKEYDIVLLERMQLEEITYAREVAKALDVPCIEITSTQSNVLIKYIVEILKL